MLEFLLAAPRSGSGKTVMTCALLAALKRRGADPCAFKCGPDYIDPMFHRAALGVPSHNLDLFLSDETCVRRLYRQGCRGHGAAVCEGAMGLYDGVGGSTDRASAWHVAQVLGLPVLLVVRPRGASLTLAAELCGLRDFRPGGVVAGLLLNDCTPMQYAALAPMLEKQTGLPALGFLPPLPQAQLPSRHLGLYTAGEIPQLEQRMEALANAAEKYIDWPRLSAVCTRRHGAGALSAPEPDAPQAAPVRVAVARDEAFCFVYEESLQALRAAGAEPVFFSPLRDAALPSGAAALYLPGGYPELYAQKLSENEPLRRAVRAAVAAGLPTVAECGGFLYLGQTLQDRQGADWPMAGALPGHARKTERLVRFGYAHLTAHGDNLLLRTGESVPVHEFHYCDSDENGHDLTAVKPVSGRRWQCGFATKSLYAAFPHLYWAGHPQLAQRFVAAARAWQTGEGKVEEKINE